MRSWKMLGAALLVLSGFALMLRGQPTLAEKITRLEPVLAPRLAGREVHIDPAELLDLMWNPRVQLVLLDVRGEADYNLFHLLDARRVELDPWNDALAKDLPFAAIKVVMSNGEARAEEAYKKLAAQKTGNLYILAGGINLWIDVYGKGGLSQEVRAAKDDVFSHEFSAALGDRHAASRPGRELRGKRKYGKKVKQAAAPSAAAGCG